MANDIDWRGLIQMVAPILGTLTQHGPNQAHFLAGWQRGQELSLQHQRERQQRTDDQNRRGADYLLRIGEHAQAMDDPADLDAFLRLAEDAGTKAGYVQPGSLRGRFTVSPNKLAEKRLKELTDQLDTFEKGGYNLDELAQGGSVLTLKDGSHVPIDAAINLTRARPQNAQGAPIARPPKVAATEEERYIQQLEKENGKKFTATQELDARKQFREAGRADKTPKEFAPGGVDAQFNDLVALWQENHPGKELPTIVRTQLRAQANKVNDKPTGLNGPGANSALDPEGIDYAATEYRVTGRMPALGMGNGAARAAIINTAAKQAKTLGQTPAAAIQRQSAYKADGAALTKMRSMSSAAESFESKALAQADIIDQLSAQVPRTQWPIINTAILSGKINLLGDSKSQQLANAVQTFSAEYAKIIEGSTGSAAGSSDSARRAADRLVNPSMNKGTMRDVLNLMRREMSLTVQGYGATIDHITTRMGGQSPPPAANPNRVYYDANGNPIRQ